MGENNFIKQDLEQNCPNNLVMILKSKEVHFKPTCLKNNLTFDTIKIFLLGKGLC